MINIIPTGHFKAVDNHENDLIFTTIIGYSMVIKKGFVIKKIVALNDITPLSALTLKALQCQMQEQYKLYRHGTISESEYLNRIRPIDRQIDSLEMSILKESFVWREASSVLFHVPEM